MFGPFVFREPRSLGHILDIIQSRACTGLSRHDTTTKALSKALVGDGDHCDLS